LGKTTTRRDVFLWGAHAPSSAAVGALADRLLKLRPKHCSEAPQWAREARALPGMKPAAPIALIVSLLFIALKPE
jgi:hypothetical protein